MLPIALSTTRVEKLVLLILIELLCSSAYEVRKINNVRGYRLATVLLEVRGRGHRHSKTEPSLSLLGRKYGEDGPAQPALIP